MASRSAAQPLPPLLPDTDWLGVTPDGRLASFASAEALSTLEPRVARQLASLDPASPGRWLFDLGAGFLSAPLPASLAFFRDFSRAFVTALRGEPSIEELRGRVELPATPDLLARWAAGVPPMPGAEYVTAGLLGALWDAQRAAFAEAIAAHDGSVQDLLAARDPRWSVVGRVHFHLAENKKDPEHPFAFLATYAAGLSAQGRPQHRPLGEAVKASSSTRDTQQLVTLLAPVHRAAERSALIRGLADSGRLFSPQAWTPTEAYRFLQELPLLEDCGVGIRVPDWWKARRPPRPQVSVSVGGAAPTGLGADALLDFQVHVTLDGTPLTAAELRALRSSADGLVLLKGQWVEVDRKKLDEVLSHFRRIEQQAEDGISFLEGMRLLAGVPLEDGGEALDPERAWSEVRAGPWLEEALAGLRAEGGQLQPTASLQAELRPYQRRGLEWLWGLTRLRLGGCLADDMGLGKTVQLLALLLLAKEKRAVDGPALLIVPASLLGNWQAEAERFAPSLRVLIAHASATDPGSIDGSRLDAADLVVTTYGQVGRLPWLSARTWGLLILDEAQAIKNPGAKQTRAVKALKAKVRFALTGTPVENRVGDLWSLFDFLNPGLLGSAKQFTAYVKQPGAFPRVRALTAPYLLRRLKTDKAIVADLPDKTELKAFCALSPQQAALYQQTVDALAQQMGTVEPIARRGLVLATLIRLKQICNHPSQWLGDGGYLPEQSGKFSRLRELCEVIAGKQEKVLVFTQFREMTEPLARWLEGLFGRPGLVLSGQTAVKARTEKVRQFQEDARLPFFVLSLKAGGTGLNLTAASHVIHFDRWWNPAVENQATDRAYRLGQKRNVLVHKLVCRGTVEERVDALIEAKQSLSRELLSDGGELRLTELSDRELLELVSLDLSRSGADGERGES